ncbi:YeaH/YhbH family protein [Rapidithrix thailandica]|uniref:UPF0229 protein AAG747_20470 n=1 Tax=Rapidithrix thailandica TaxID=413964 RepID=A0AAW9SBH1_9BACT
MSTIIDRRKNPKGKSINNRQKFLKRVEGQIKKAIPDILSKESIKDSSQGGKVRVPIRGIKEPSFAHDPKTGNKEYIRPGNDRFVEGDRIPKPQGGEGAGGGKGSNSPGTTEDSFVVVLSREEFLKYFFEDLELPNLIKKYLENTEEFKTKRAGFVKYGVPSRLNIKSSYQQSLARHISLKGAFENKLKELEAKLARARSEKKKAEVEEEIVQMLERIRTIPFFEEIDMRYNNFEKVPMPITSAVMFCIMDVSASMGYREKDIAKRFFTLLYIFLTKQYKSVELVFIRHHTESKEVDEHEFFNSRESGGTIVAPSLKMMQSIIQERYHTGQWNIYCCQASDGDVWSDEDAYECAKIVKTDLMPVIQYMAYIEINSHGSGGSLWQAYKRISDEHIFSIRNIYDVNQIWPVFKGLFKKRKVLETS